MIEITAFKEKYHRIRLIILPLCDEAGKGRCNRGSTSSRGALNEAPGDKGQKNFKQGKKKRDNLSCWKKGGSGETEDRMKVSR